MDIVNKNKDSIILLLQTGLILVLTFHVLLPLLHGVYKYFIRSGVNVSKLGEWAVVTGATDGIGKAMAFEFARKKMKVLLISRTDSKLKEVKSEIIAKHQVEVDTLAIDFSQLNESSKESLRQKLLNLDIGVLVNNVGMSYPHPSFYQELTEEQISQLVELNITSTTFMTYLVLPEMRNRKRGAIINIGSAAGENPGPLLAEYAAAKAFVKMFSESLAVETAQYNIYVQCQIPLYVSTKLAKIRNQSLTVPSPSKYARAAINAIGHEVVISPYWCHALMLYCLSLVPTWLVNSYILKMHLGIRKKALKKAEEKKL